MKAVSLETVSIIYLSSSQAKCTNLTSLVCLLNEVALGCGRAMSGKRESWFSALDYSYLCYFCSKKFLFIRVLGKDCVTGILL